MIKASEVHPAVLSAWRLLIAAAVLSPLFFRAWKREREHFGWRDLRRSFLPALILALHFISWTEGARLTLAANATLIVNMVPIAMPFFVFLLLRERVTGTEAAGTVLAVGGVILLAWGDYRLEPGNLPGDLVCLGSMLLFALYLAYGRLNRGARNLWLYLVPLYALAGCICLLVAVPFQNPLQAFPPREWALLLGIGLGPTVIGHSLLNFSLKHISSQSVSVCNVAQFLFAGSMAYFFFHEVPHLAFLPAAILVVAGCVLAVWSLRPNLPRISSRYPGPPNPNRT